MSQTPPPSGRWAHPLLLAVAGPVVGGIFAVAIFWLGQSKGVLPTPTTPSTEAQGPTTASPTSATANTTASSGSPSSSAATSPAARPVLYGPNEIRFKSVDLDAVPPVQTGVIGPADLYTRSVTGSSVVFDAYYNALIAPWDGASPPRPEDCDDRLARLPQDEVNAVAGSTVCVQTNEEAVAAVTLTSTDQEEDAVLVSVVVWSGP